MRVTAKASRENLRPAGTGRTKSARTALCAIVCKAEDLNTTNAWLGFFVRPPDMCMDADMSLAPDKVRRRKISQHYGFAGACSIRLIWAASEVIISRAPARDARNSPRLATLIALCQARILEALDAITDNSPPSTSIYIHYRCCRPEVEDESGESTKHQTMCFMGT